MASAPNNEMAHIHRLNCDTLVQIFEFNTDMFSDYESFRVLEQARNTSHVCREWRALLLATPGLWARILNFNEILVSRATPEWIAELLRRTGSAPLHIKADRGLNGYVSTDIARCLFEVLRENWHRVRNLAISVSDYEWGLNNAPLWDWMYTPAPRLEMFDVDFGIDSLEASRPYAPLFGDRAPSLHTFRGYSFWDVKAPWLQQLRRMDIDQPFNVYQTLVALQTTANLEILQIDRLSKLRDPTPPFPNVHLPQLTRLDLAAHFLKCVEILDHLEIPPNCSLTYCPRDLNRRQFAQHRMTPMINALSKAARRHFKAITGTVLELCIGSQSLHFYHREKGRIFFIWITCDNGILMPRHATTTFLADFALPEFAQITSLLLRLPATAVVHEMATFLACFPAVTILSTGQSEINQLLHIQDMLESQNGAPTLIFPSLKIVNLPQAEFLWYSEPASKVTATHKFVAARREAGCEVEVGSGGNEYHNCVRMSSSNPIN
ncbi:hypothetical protein HYPSUDRAFT_36423 [Hypholoma sublateritium FD-334 SS-4]|uniref:Uncharacterized protein n=1 Tax=Hypholoma sublateritium (strain FD-334 SS-4) TaxID=945553 RepID=A0A0D2Q5A3_HYPSF|nr:hypothetical protein HYPSUDRAFT_36423 [Hypholoma sublateritium FD-334 SS-4]